MKGTSRMHTSLRRLLSIALCLLLAVGTARAGEVYVQTNLVTNNQSLAAAQQTDPNLQGTWGLSFTTTSPLWVSNQFTGTATLYKLNVTPPTVEGLVVGVANQGNAPPSGPAMTNGPTGQVATGAPGITTVSTDFQVGGSKAAFIFANLDGSISGWNGGAHSTIEATVAGASFTGLAIGNLPGPGVPPRSTPPTRTAATSTSSIASGT